LEQDPVQIYHYYFNASLIAFNLTALDALSQHSGQESFGFSLASVKRRMDNGMSDRNLFTRIYPRSKPE
jgi:hypothetical protein